MGKNGPISLREVGKVVMNDMPPTIERKDRERIVTVDAVMAAGAALSDGVSYGESIIEKMDIPSGIAIEVAGSYEDQMESNRDLGQPCRHHPCTCIHRDGITVRVTDLSVHPHVLGCVRTQRCASRTLHHRF